MDKKYITKSELAKIYGVSAPYISKLFKKGLFDDCIENGKIIRDLALSRYAEIKKPNRESQREAVKRKKSSKDEIEAHTDTEIKKSNLFNKKNIEQLKDLISEVKSPNQKVQIIKDFWTGKLNEQKFLENEKKLIPKEVVIKDVQRILKAFRDKALALPNRMSGDLVGVEDKTKIAEIVEGYIYELLDELSQLEDEDDS